jgi:mono/diheme cytochrome c family protein
MRLIFRMVRAAVVAACLLPCASAGVLAVRRQVSGPPEKICRMAEEPFVPTSKEHKSSAVVVARFGYKHVAFVADADEQEIVAYDADNGRVLGREGVGGSPSQLLLDPKGRLYVTARDANVIRVFEPSASAVSCREGPLLRPIAELPTASEPVALAQTKDGASLHAITGWGHTLEVFSTKTHERTLKVDVPREPRAIVLDDSEDRAFLSHATGALSVVDLRGQTHEVRRITYATRETIPSEVRNKAMHDLPFISDVEGFGIGMIGLLGREDIPPMDVSKTKPALPRASTQGFALASLNGRLLAPEVLVQPGKMPEPSKDGPPVRPTGYGSSGPSSVPTFGPATAHVAVVEMSNESVLHESKHLTIDDRSCLLPRAAAIDPERRTLLVACLGTNEVAEYDARSPDPTRALKGRWSVPEGPTGLAVFEDRVAVWSSFDRVLTIIGRGADVVHASTTKERAPTPFEVGRKIFHASTSRAISSDGRACASCHPDGRDDGLTWTSPDGPRQTPMLAGRLAETAPFGWTGASATVEQHLRETLKRLEGRGLEAAETYALLTYLSKMKTPARTPAPNEAAIARGRKIFDSYETGCSSCHTVKDGKAVGDGDVHDVGSKARGDVEKEIATPSLQFVGGTGPYFHDGRYATLDDLLADSKSMMGQTRHLTKADREALTSYLESL